MSYFDPFNKALVVIPPHYELRRRTNRRNEEMGSPVPENAIHAMKGEFVLLQGVLVLSISIQLHFASGEIGDL